MTTHLQIDDDTDCEGDLVIEKLSALRCKVTCDRCGESFDYLRAPTSPQIPTMTRRRIPFIPNRLDDDTLKEA